MRTLLYYVNVCASKPPPSQSHTHAHIQRHAFTLCFGLRVDNCQHSLTPSPSVCSDFPLTVRSTLQRSCYSQTRSRPLPWETQGGCWALRTGWSAPSRRESSGLSHRWRGCPRCLKIPLCRRDVRAGSAGWWAGLKKAPLHRSALWCRAGMRPRQVLCSAAQRESFSY